MRLIKRKKGDKIGKMVVPHGYTTVEVSEPGITIEIGSRIGFVSWKQIEDFKKARAREIDLDPGI